MSTATAEATGSSVATTAQTATSTASTAAATTATAATTSTVGDHWGKLWIRDDFKLDSTALDKLPEHLKGMKDTLGKYGTLEDALVGWHNQQVMAGKKALAPLPPDAPETVRTERKALLDTVNGVPPTPKDYGIIKPADFPAEQWNQKLADGVMAWAHKNSIPPGALKELVFEVNANAVKEQMQQQATYETQFWQEQDRTFAATLQREGIELQRASSLVEKGAIALGLDLNDEGTKTFLKGANARLMAMRHAIAIGEDKAAVGPSGNEGGDPETLANDVLSNPANPLHGQYWNKDGKYSRSDHDAAVERVNQWRKLAWEREQRKAGAAR